MNDIGMLLRDQLGDGTPPSEISITGAIGQGRRIIRRRRVVTSVAAGLATVLVATAVGWASRTGPVPGGTPSSSPGVSAPPDYEPSFAEPPSGPSRPGPGAGDLPVFTGLGRVGGPAQVLEGGAVVADLPTSPATAVDNVVAVPDGWVFLQMAGINTQHPTQAVWFQPTGGTARRVASVYGDFRVSDDGTVLVVAGVQPGQAGEIVAYSLPSLSALRSTTFATAGGPVVMDVRGDWALLAAAPGTAPGPGELWNVRTGQTVPFAGPSYPLDVARDGSVLRRVDRADGTGTVVSSCFDVVDPGATVPTGPTGSCRAHSTSFDMSGTLSPSGEWAVLDMGPGDGFLEVVRASDLHAGRWVPTQVAFYGEVQFWDSETTFIVSTDRFERCDVTGGCTPLDVPSGGDLRCVKNFLRLTGC